MTKSIPLSRRELQRGGGALNMSRNDPKEFYMAANTEIEFIKSQEDALTKKISSAAGKSNKNHSQILQMQLDKERLTRRRMTVIFERDKCTSHGELFKARAKKALQPDVYDMIAKMAGADCKVIEESMVVDHKESGGLS